MKVILDLNGWRRVVEAPEDVVNSGRIDYALESPLTYLVFENAAEPVPEMAFYVASFYYYGKKNSGMFVFEYTK